MTTEKRPIEISDLTRMIALEDPQVSPDEKWIAYVQVTPDLFENNYSRNIWVVPTDGGEPLQLTYSGKDTSPRWSPDGKTLAFVSSRSEKSQIYCLPVNGLGGEAKVLTKAENGASNPVWSPDGTQIAYLGRMNAEERAREDEAEEQEPPQDPLDGKHRKERKEQDETQRWDPRPMWRIPYRTGTAFLDDRYAQIYVLELNGTEEEKPRRLTDVDANHAPPSWLPDGKTLITARSYDLLGDMPWRTTNLYSIPVDGGMHTRIIDEEYAIFMPPQVSPNGKWIACTRVEQNKTDHLTRFSIVSTEDGETRVLNPSLEAQEYSYQWTNDNQLMVTYGKHGKVELFQCNPENGETKPVIIGEHYIESLSVGETGGVAYIAFRDKNLWELYWLPVGTSEPQQLTAVNQPFLDEVITQEIHEIWYKSPSGVDLQGWYLLPVGYEEGKQYPLALNIHGGPHVMWGAHQSSMWHEWQSHAAQGYVVFFCNPRGADGYGETFMSALHANWGNVAMEDILAGVNVIIEKGLVNEAKMAITGGSYGGYMTSWIISHSDRFCSAVSQRGVYNLSSFYGTSDVPMLITNEYDVYPWENPQLLLEHSPIAHAQNINTPLLIIHSENDYRVPIEQAEQLFAYLRRMGKTVRMLRYPREGHDLSRNGEPKHRISRLEEMVAWFNQYCRA